MTLNRSPWLIAAVLALSMTVPAVASEILRVYKSPSCGCCSGWVEHVAAAGFSPEVSDQEDVEPVKDRLGVPEHLRSCHTATIQGYVIEGHVPATAIARLLKERPRITGLAAPGMPPGSPGMSGPKQPFEVYAFGPGGERRFMPF